MRRSDTSFNLFDGHTVMLTSYLVLVTRLLSFRCVVTPIVLVIFIDACTNPVCLAKEVGPREPTAIHHRAPASTYTWTIDHMQVGVRWQPFAGRPGNNAFDASRPVIAKNSSYVQFWMSWAALEPSQKNTDYTNSPSGYFQMMDWAVNACREKKRKVEFVFFHCPAWASESGKSGGQRPKAGLFAEFVTRIATHFKGRVEAYQLSHEVNNQGLMQGADVPFLIDEIFIAGAKAIRNVYSTAPSAPVIISTSGMSPCERCKQMEGLTQPGGRGVNQLYDAYIANPELMQLVDALNLNVSDQNDGYGGMDGSFVSSVWGNYDLVRRKLDRAGYDHKGVLSAESWVSWDNGGSAVDVNGDGIRDEQDAYEKTLTIMGHCLERGLNTLQLPWSDNSSGWAMGLTKRRDYNGRIAQLNADIVVPARDGGPGVVTRKLALRGNDSDFVLSDGSGEGFTIANYINPGDPNHLHYYVWRWFAGVAGGSDEVVRHAVAGEIGNDIAVTGSGFTGNERYRIASYNRSQNTFSVLLYASGANGQAPMTVRIPCTIQTGRHSNTGQLSHDFRGEGFQAGDMYVATIETKNIHCRTGDDLNVTHYTLPATPVEDGLLIATIPKAQRFTRIDFVRP